jgi:superfamily I DNA/RNA helicase
MIELLMDEETRQNIIKKSSSGKPLIELIPSDFIKRHMRPIELARSVWSKELPFETVENEMKECLGNEFTGELLNFLQRADASLPQQVDKKLATICLTTFKGCKGLSAGHVFIVGVHNGCMPKDNDHIRDVEISQFIVALTRTRKRCHILWNDWWAGPVDRKGRVPRFEPSLLLNWIPKELIDDRGNLRSADLK